MLYKDYFLNVNGQNCFIRKPKVSNGSGIIILGGSGCYVTENTSDYHKNIVRNDFLNSLVSIGFTVGYSNTHNKSWGSDFAVKDVENLYEIMIKKFNVNPKINLIGVSMGGILALNILKGNIIKINKLVLVKPVMDLIKHREYILSTERFDRIAEELSSAYKIEKDSVSKYLECSKSKNKYQNIPIKIIYGASDILVPFENNFKVLSELQDTTYVEIVSIQEANHKDDKLFFNIEFYERFFK